MFIEPHHELFWSIRLGLSLIVNYNTHYYSLLSVRENIIVLRLFSQYNLGIVPIIAHPVNISQICAVQFEAHQYTGMSLVVVGAVHTVEPLLTCCVPEI